jgi:hypothetical protein
MLVRHIVDAHSSGAISQFHFWRVMYTVID